MDDPASARKLKKNKIFYTEFSGYRLSNLFKRITAVVMRNIRCAVYESNSFLAKETYNSLPIGWLLSDLLEKVFDEEFPRKAQEIDAIRKIILTYKPKVIVIRDCFFNISIIAKSMSIPVVAMQTSHADEFIFPARVVADAMTVDGNYWKEYLERNAVDPSRIWITGSPKFDILHNNGFGYKNSDLKLELDKSKKLIVFATSYSALALGMLEYERTSHIHSLFSAVKNIKDVHLIVKLHPFEKDISTYRKIAHSVGLLNYSVVNNIDILDLLYKSDLLVTYFSTTAYEAVLMNKNVILLNSNSNFNPVDFWDFKRYGVAICADSPQKLEGYIRKALFDPETISCLNAKRKEYIFDHAYRIDGKATERVREVISRFI
jgi:predicted glycosyltransferase